MALPTGFSAPSGFNTFVPSFEASGHLIVAYSRNPKSFPINKYMAIKGVNKSQGYFLNLTAEEAARILNSNLSEAIWADGNDAPSDEYGNETFNYVPFSTTRYQWGFNIGYKASEQADWKILAQYAAIKAAQAMTGRSVLAWNVLTNTANYATSHVMTATQWSTKAGTPGFLNTGTGTNPVLKAALNAMMLQIHYDTLGSVNLKDMIFVIDPVIADALGRSQEVHQFLANSPFALAQVRGDQPNQNALWGLPTEIYGYPIVVEDTVQTTTKKVSPINNPTSTATRQLVTGGNTAVLCARPGALVSEAGGTDFSTLQGFFYEEMTVETKDDPDNRKTRGRLVEDYGIYVVAPASGALCTHVLS
jgi:hypothetical protein